MVLRTLRFSKPRYLLILLGSKFLDLLLLLFILDGELNDLLSLVNEKSDAECAKKEIELILGQ